MAVWRRLLDREASDRGRGEGATGRASKAWALGEAGRQRQGGPRAGAAVLVVVVASFLRSANRGRHEHDVPVSGWLHARGGKPAKRQEEASHRAGGTRLYCGARSRGSAARATAQPGDPALFPASSICFDDCSAWRSSIISPHAASRDGITESELIPRHDQSYPYSVLYFY